MLSHHAPGACHVPRLSIVSRAGCLPTEGPVAHGPGLSRPPTGEQQTTCQRLETVVRTLSALTRKTAAARRRLDASHHTLANQDL
ncbi:MAG: hypothetical protein H7838_11160 [Magnetococcus sp. DMHC-8]